MSRTARTAVSVALLAVLAACGVNGGPAVPASPPAADPSPPAADPSPTPSGCSAHVVVGENANGTTVCAVLGSDLIVALPARGGGSWPRPEVTGGALEPGRGIPTPDGTVGWSFRAVATGTAEISTARPNCPPASPGTLACHSMTAFNLKVVVGH
jgi:hypothetical protein